VEWTGAVHAEIFAELGAKDCDIIVRVSDVYPDGRSMLIADCHRRASFRAGLNLPPTLLEPGDRCKVVFRVGWMSQNFNAGHRIRVTVSCTGLPLYETGGNGLDDSAGRSTHSVLHGAAQPSCVLAPVIPSGSQADCVDMSEMMMADLEAGVFPA
jgi:predicted acyl esterase